jgi:hypothetical protein
LLFVFFHKKSFATWLNRQQIAVLFGVDRTALPLAEGIFFDGQIFDAYKFVADLIKSAKQSIVLIDNYIDDSVLMLLSKRNNDITAIIYTAQIIPESLEKLAVLKLLSYLCHAAYF